MRILWITNIPLPEASSLMGQSPSPFGGWLVNSSKHLADDPDVELSIAFPSSNTKHYEKFSGAKISYYAFQPVEDCDKGRLYDDKILRELVKDIKPDLVHIFGTEMAHSLSMVNVCNREKIEAVISIQGLVSAIEKHAFASLPFKAIYGMTFRNLLKQDNVAGLRRLYARRGKNEIEAIMGVKHVIGRTTWDKACVTQINPDVRYHFCNETLRQEFYKHSWSIDKCIKHTIFVSQGQSPIKGLHHVLEAMPLIVARFPNAKLVIAGKDITKDDTFLDRLSMSYYGRYIKQLIHRLGLTDKVLFTGSLGEKQMCERYLKSNVFVSASSIENSPNSLGEAMILGVPCIASNVGGVPDMLEHRKEGFTYQADAPYMLAHYVCEIFGNDNLAITFSERARERAYQTHNPEINNQQLISIYRDILGLSQERSI